MNTTIITEKMVFGGNCIAKIEGKNVFVPYAIPGEKLLIETVESKKDYDTAKIIEIIEPSPKRITPECPYYQKCGGCNLMHIDYNYQIELRKQILKDIFEKHKIEIPEIQTVTANALNYRSRFQLHDGGMEERHSNEKVFIDKCLIAEKPVNDYLNSTQNADRPKGRCHLFGSKYAEPPFSISTPRIKNIHEQKKGRKTVRPKYQGTVINENTLVSVTLLGKKIMFDVQGFFQSNLGVLEKTIEILTSDLKGKNALDMYSGCGTFSVFLEDRFEHITLVEHNRDAIVFAEQNLKLKNHESYGISGAKWVKENSASIINRYGDFDTVIIDPPRSGMEKDVVEFLSKNKPYDLRIMSCDPVTNARDIKTLCNSEYKVKKLFLLDFYPQTSHIESLAFLKPEI